MERAPLPSRTPSKQPQHSAARLPWEAEQTPNMCRGCVQTCPAKSHRAAATGTCERHEGMERVSATAHPVCPSMPLSAPSTDLRRVLSAGQTCLHDYILPLPAPLCLSHACTHMYTQVNTNIHVYPGTHVCGCAHTYTGIHVPIRLHVHECKYTQVHTRTHHTGTRAHTYTTHMHMCTHTQTHTPSVTAAG